MSVGELDRRFLWHPFTQMRDWLSSEPLVIASGEGNFLIDERGRRYLDGVSSLWCNVHGHRHPAIDRAVTAQLGRIAHSTSLGLTHAPAAELAARLVEVAPAGLRRVFYSDAGATAVEIALKLAFQYWQLRGHPERRRFASLVEAYHGDTIGAVSLGYSETFHRFHRPLLFDVLRLPPPHLFRRAGLDDAAACSAAIAAGRRDVRAPRQRARGDRHRAARTGRRGNVDARDRLLAGDRSPRPRSRDAAGVRRGRDRIRAHRRDVRIADRRRDARPACVSARGSPAAIYRSPPRSRPRRSSTPSSGPYEDFVTFFHGHTYTGNPLACAAGIASLEVFASEDTLANVATRAGELAGRLASDVAGLAHVGDVRQRGLMVGIELVPDRRRWTEPYPPAARIGHRVCEAVRRHGVILRPLGNVIVLMPPLGVSSDEIALLVDATAAAIRAVTEA
jgi:adenosylmethionine-8-amino-7-oxononanoate aminotransferase